MKTGHTAKFMGWLKLRAIKGTSQVAIVSDPPVSTGINIVSYLVGL